MKSPLTTVQAAAVDNLLAVPVTDADGSFSGTFAPTRFAAQDGSLLAAGTLTGTLGEATLVEEVTIPVVEIGGTVPGASTRARAGGSRPFRSLDAVGADSPDRRGWAGAARQPRLRGTHLRDSGTGLWLVPDLLNQILARL